jgi:hypothetical protein
MKMSLKIIFVMMMVISIECRSTLLPDLKTRIEITSTTVSSKSTTYEPQVQCYRNKFVVVKNTAYIVRDFALSDSFNFSCNLEYLPIEFQLTHDGSTSILTMYMGSSGCELHPAQKNTRYCKRIRR